MISAARSGLMISCRCEFSNANLSGFTGGPRSVELVEVLGGGMPFSRDIRPLLSGSRDPFVGRS